MSGIVPAKIAAAFTPGELAVLSIIGREVQRRGTCTLPVDQIAAQAGVCRRIVQYAMGAAREIGLIIDVRQAPAAGDAASRVISREWLSWLKLGGGRKSVRPTDNQESFFATPAPETHRRKPSASPRGGQG